MPQHATRTSFKPGVVTNPNGRPRLPPEIKDIRAVARTYTMEALDVFIRNINNKDYAIASDAARELINRGWGKVVERKELTGEGGGAIKIEDNTPSIRVLLQQVLTLENDPIIEESSDNG